MQLSLIHICVKNTGNIIMKNLMDMCLGTIFFWLIGFGIMQGADVLGIIGTPDPLIRGDYGVEGGYPSWAFVIFQTVFCATAATIVSGAMAERTKFSAYLSLIPIWRTARKRKKGAWKK